MRQFRHSVLATFAVTLAYLGESLLGPVAGRVALGFGQPAADGFAFMTVAFYGTSVSGFVIQIFVRDGKLGRWLASALVIGSVLNMLALDSGNWIVALALRAAAGCCFGVTVGGTMILLAQTVTGSKLARTVSLLFSMVFLSFIPVMLFGPAMADRIGAIGLSTIHLVLCAGTAALLAFEIQTKRSRTRKSQKGIVDTLSSVFWSRGKALALAVHVANMFAALLILIGLQPAAFGRGLGEPEIGAFLAVLSASTLIGGFVHAALVRRMGLKKARWILILGEVAIIPVATVCLIFNHHDGAYFAAFALCCKGILGGPPSFEALLYDLGPRDAACAGFQRSLGTIVAITGVTVLLALARSRSFDFLSAMLFALAAASAVQVAAYFLLSRDKKCASFIA